MKQISNLVCSEISTETRDKHWNVPTAIAKLSFSGMVHSLRRYKTSDAQFQETTRPVSRKDWRTSAPFTLLRGGNADVLPEVEGKIESKG